ncbi:hypothetical protein BZG75_03930 [Salinivibrio sp. AR640]|nr:hypothetical protein BZG75_03930 [Salinivibrio sp. AR640]
MLSQTRNGYNFRYIRTTNPIESMFARVRLITNKTKSCGSRETTLLMACKLLELPRQIGED